MRACKVKQRVFNNIGIFLVVPGNYKETLSAQDSLVCYLRAIFDRDRRDKGWDSFSGDYNDFICSVYEECVGIIEVGL